MKAVGAVGGDGGGSIGGGGGGGGGSHSGRTHETCTSGWWCRCVWGWGWVSG